MFAFKEVISSKQILIEIIESSCERLLNINYDILDYGFLIMHRKYNTWKYKDQQFDRLFGLCTSMSYLDFPSTQKWMSMSRISTLSQTN